MAERPGSAFAELVRDRRRTVTTCPDVGILSPWSTWPTLHRGVINERHLITDFGQDLSDVDRSFPPIRKLLQRAGIGVT